MRACAVAVLVGVVACANPNLERARHARYNVDAAIAFQGALEATQARYAEVEANPDDLMIKTAWHQVREAAQDVTPQQPMNPGNSGSPATGLRSPRPVRKTYRRLFVRFDIRVRGERPYTVDITSYGAEWKPGNAMPTELEGSVRPGWIDERADSLRAEIYKRLRTWAVVPVTTAAR